jgi:hypothetical protein
MIQSEILNVIIEKFKQLGWQLAQVNLLNQFVYLLNLLLSLISLLFRLAK